MALAHFLGIDSWQALGWVALGGAIVVALFVVQYSIFGYDRYLGFDTSTYVETVRWIQVSGPASVLVHLDYPSLYVFVDWIIAMLTGSIELGERILPAAMGMVLVALYFRLGRELFREKSTTYAGITAILAAVVPNTMRLMADLHRNLFTLIAVLSALVLLAEFAQGKRSRRNAFVWLLVLSALAAYSEIETYAVFLVAVLVYCILDRRIRWGASAAVALPVLVATPFMIGYFTLYSSYLLIHDPADPLLSVSDFIYYHGGLLPLLPLAVLGALLLALRAREPSPVPRLLLIWYGILMALVAFLGVVPTALPASRALYLVPVPILLTLAIRELSRTFSRGAGLARARLAGPTRPRPGPGRMMNAIVTSTIAVLVILSAGIGLSEQKDLYMQPFIDSSQYAALVEIGRALRPYSSAQPIVVFNGVNGTWDYRLGEAYAGALSRPVVGYFGRPQFLFSLTDPLFAEPWLSNDPNPSRFAASKIYGEFLGAVRNTPDLSVYSVVVSAPSLYDSPVSDYVVVKHRVSSDLYVIPPGSVTPLDLDTWMWFAAYDWRAASSFNSTGYPWALAPQGLEYSTPALTQPWTMEYLMELSTATPNATLSLHLLDTPPFPSSWNVLPSSVGTFTVYVDNVSVARYAYGYQGVKWVSLGLASLSAGYHTVRIQADDLGRAFALGLDALAFCPNGMALSTLLSAYAA